MTATLISGDVASYLAAVRAHLEGLPAADLDDVLQDLEDHLREVAAEGEGTLATRLGPPEAYAAELRASAGLPELGTASRPPWRRRLLSRLARTGPGRLVATVGATAPYRQLRDFLTELRPGWWVLRGFLAVAAWSYLFGVSLFASRLIGLVVLLLGAWGSVALGRRSDRSGRVRRWAPAVNGLVVVLSLIAFTGGTSADIIHPSGAGYPGDLHRPDGTAITNIHPYAADGTPLEGVMLFDQVGRPITVPAPPYATTFPPAQPYPTTFDDDGTRNGFPLRPGGRQRPSPAPTPATRGPILTPITPPGG